MIDTIQKRYNETLENKAQGKFRAYVYQTMETMAKNLETSPYASSEDIPQLGAFSREIATWICHQSSPFHLSKLSNFVINTKRSLSTTMLTHVDHEVKKSILAMSNSDYVIGEGFMKVRLGTRASNLAMWQATAVYSHLKQQGISSEIVPLTSKGDRSFRGPTLYFGGSIHSCH